MNVTSGIVKNRSKQAPWLRESCDHGWKEKWKRLPCNNCRGSFWVYDSLACRLQSLHRTVASRSHTWKLLIFLLLDISGVLDRFTDLRGAVFEGGEADALAHEDARSPHPRRIAGDDFSERLFPQARPAQKEPSAYFDQIYVAGIAE